MLLRTKEGVKIDFVHFPFSPLYNTITSGPIPTFDLGDLASNNAHTIGRRATWRDYVDIFFLLKRKRFDLGNISKEAKKRFGGEFSQRLFLEQLVYFDDISIVPIDFLKVSYTNGEIKKYLKKEVEKYTRTILQNPKP